MSLLTQQPVLSKFNLLDLPGVFIVNFELISHLFLVFLLLDLEQVNVSLISTKTLVIAAK